MEAKEPREIYEIYLSLHSSGGIPVKNLLKTLPNDGSSRKFPFFSQFAWPETQVFLWWHIKASLLSATLFLIFFHQQVDFLNIVLIALFHHDIWVFFNRVQNFERVAYKLD